jgi:TonB family protein
MKIVCDACQAKYSISDDKVQGKVFKIRCKKCSNIIVVRGGQNAAEQAPAPAVEKDTRVYDYGYDGAQGGGGGGGDESVWHVVINQDQVGPMTVAEVQQRFAAGEIDADTYIWREGFADWLPISQVDAFADYVSSGSTTAAVSSRAGQDAVASMFGGGNGNDESGTVRSDPGDLFAAASAGSGRHQQPADDDGDMFGSKAPRAAAQPAQAADAAGSKLRGERNENSVLFSLGNLAQLASDKPAPVTAAPSSSHGGAGGGQSGGEGSGLIDIRSMANAYLGGGGGGAGMAAKASTSSAIGTMDDLPVFGTGGFSEPAVMMPTQARQSNNKLMLALIGSVGILAVAAVILVVVLVSGGDDKKPTVAKGDETSANGKTGGDTDDGTKDETGDSSGATGDTGSSNSGATGDTGSSAEPTSGGTDVPATGKDPDPVKQPTVEPDKGEKPVKPDKGEKPSSSKPDKGEKPTKTEKPDKGEKPTKTEKPVKAETPSSGGCDEVGCVISGYEGTCCAKFKKGGKTTTTTTGGGGKSDLPSSLDRAAISEGVGKVKGRVMACGDKSSSKGTVKVSVKVTADGNVSSVSVKESPDSSLGSCVAKAMEKASFKKTQGGGSFSYPFVF